MVGPPTKKDKAIREPCSALERRFAATDPDRDRPRRLRHESGAVDPIEAAREVHNRVGEQPAKQLDLLFLACASRTKVLSQCFVLDLVPTDANAQSKPTTRREIDIGGLTCHERSLALRQDQDPRREPDALGDAGQISEHHERIVERILLGAGAWQRRCSVGVDGTQYMVVGKKVIETQILDCPPNPSNSDWIASKLDLAGRRRRSAPGHLATRLGCRVRTARTADRLAGRAPDGQSAWVQTEPVPVPAERERRQRIALGLAWATIAWNTVEAVVAIGAGAVASSIALISFGLDSTVEVLSASVIVWQMTRDVPEDREARALRLIAVSFFALAGYVTVQAIVDLLTGNEPDTSTVGIVLAAVSLVVMPVLAWLKRRNGRRLGSNSVVADSRQTMLCTYLSAVLLIGLVLNATVGWWWADPLAALVIAALAFHEGREAWRGENCCEDDACTA